MTSGPTHPPERRLAAILAADIVGYSRLMGRDEGATIASLKEVRAEIAPIIARHGGAVVDTAGDGILVQFPSAVRAVECAVAMQRSMVARHQRAAKAHRMLYRIGVNVGDVVIDGGSLYGDGVNVAARLEALAEPGGICVSGAVFDQVRGKVDLAFEPLGRKSLKNIALPVNVYRVPLNGRSRRFLARWLAGCDWRRRRFGIAVAAIMVASVSSCWMFESNDPPGSGRSTVAVLPWRATSPDETTAKLADGLTESIVVALTRNGQAEVVASSLTADYKGKLVKARDVGSALNVGYVIEGTIRREDGKVRISAQLIDASTEVILWSDSWERTLEDPFTMQTEIADQLASSIRRAL